LRYLKIVAMGLATTIVVLITLWGVLALWYQAPGGVAGKSLAIALWLLIGGVALAMLRTHRPVLGIVVFALAFAGLLLWWRQIAPTTDRAWADDVAQMTTGEVTGHQVTLHNVRNFDWRTNTDYTQRWETRTYDLDRLDSVDLITSYWTGPAIAHVLVSFGFTDGRHVVFSVEVRRRKDEGFSEIGGFFKDFDLSVIAADERDVIRVRTNVRGEDDYLYRIQMPIAAMRALFLAYVGEADRLVVAPRFYNTLTANCTTLVYHMMRNIVGYLPLDYRLVLSGYLPAYVYKVGGLDKRYSLQELRRLGHITERAKAADRDERFSDLIRVGIPALPSHTLASLDKPI
jgi:hypothetical protein